jgi:hypothetical protein
MNTLAVFDWGYVSAGLRAVAPGKGQKKVIKKMREPAIPTRLLRKHEIGGLVPGEVTLDPLRRVPNTTGRIRGY